MTMTVVVLILAVSLFILLWISDKKRQMLIYIAGPLSAPTEEQRLANVYRAIDAGLAVYRKGHIPFIPHLSHWADRRAEELGLPMEWEDWMAIDDAWLRECDALLYLGSSPGADIELQRAMDLGLDIYFTLEAIPVERQAEGEAKRLCG